MLRFRGLRERSLKLGTLTHGKDLSPLRGWFPCDVQAIVTALNKFSKSVNFACREGIFCLPERHSFLSSVVYFPIWSANSPAL
jgi:hypothetical protein